MRAVQVIQKLIIALEVIGSVFTAGWVNVEYNKASM